MAIDARSVEARKIAGPEEGNKPMKRRMGWLWVTLAFGFLAIASYSLDIDSGGSSPQNNQPLVAQIDGGKSPTATATETPTSSPPPPPPTATPTPPPPTASPTPPPPTASPTPPPPTASPTPLPPTATPQPADVATLEVSPTQDVNLIESGGVISKADYINALDDYINRNYPAGISNANYRGEAVSPYSLERGCPASGYINANGDLNGKGSHAIVATGKRREGGDHEIDTSTVTLVVGDPNNDYQVPCDTDATTIFITYLD